MSPQTLAPAPLASCEFQYKIIFKMEIYVILSLISIFSRFFLFLITMYHIHWFYPNRSFKNSNWWRHKLGHT